MALAYEDGRFLGQNTPATLGVNPPHQIEEQDDPLGPALDLTGRALPRHS